MIECCDALEQGDEDAWFTGELDDEEKEPARRR